MRKGRSIAIAVLVAVLFLIANRGAYQGYFSGDDLDNINWTLRTTGDVFLRGLATLQFNPDNFRPVGHSFFLVMSKTAGMDFKWYVAVVQALHLGVALLVFLLARSFGATSAASAIGSLFFVFHMALFGAFWKPMYVFDVLCGLFCCLSVLAWKRSGALWWIVSFLSFWLAYKSKEVAVMLPAALLVVELLGSERRWLRLMPFLGVSIVFGAQAVLYSLMAAFNHTRSPYQLQLTTQTLAATAAFYAEHVFLSVWGLVLLAVILVFARNRWGALASLLLVIPMLLLPGRIYSVYLYVPLAFLVLTVASAADRSIRVAAPLLVVWLGVNFAEMRRLRNEALAEGQDARVYVNTLQNASARLADASEVRVDGYPRQLDSWGAKAAADLFRFDLDGGTHGTLTLSWQPSERKLYLFDERPVSFLDMSTGTAIQKTDTGWYAPEGDYRWTQPVAHLHLARPAAARLFELKLQVPAEQLASANGRVVVETLLDGKMLAPIALDKPGWKTVQTKTLPPTGQLVEVEIRVKPPFRPPGDGRELGIAVGAVGFR